MVTGLTPGAPIAPLLDQMLGPAYSTHKVVASLDAQYKAEGKSPIHFLPLTEPISPHLDELLVPVEPDVSAESTTE
ncbi:MAG: hypothetical protein R3C18_04445 [Planctomycetaceae bacterium]